MKKRCLMTGLTLALSLSLSLILTAKAAPTFSDVPSTHWAYDTVEAAAGRDLMNGTGGGLFSPDMKVSLDQFLTLVGRVVFPDIAPEGDDWAGPYITAAQETGLLAGADVDMAQPGAEVARYDMAVILRAAAKLMGVSDTPARPDQVADYDAVPGAYTDAVRSVYGMGLIQGDQNGNFNGSTTMSRAEVATVVVRLADLKPSRPNPQPKPEAELTTYVASGNLRYWPSDADIYKSVKPGTPIQICYTADDGITSVLVAEGAVTVDVLGAPSGYFSVEFKADPESVLGENGHYFVRAKIVENGVEYVTADLRPDGAIIPVYVHRDGSTTALDVGYQTNHIMTPSAGAKRTLIFDGNVKLNWTGVNGPGVDLDGHGNILPSSGPGAGVTVYFGYTDLTGTDHVLATQVTDENGEYRMTAHVDVVDYARRVRIDSLGNQLGDIQFWVKTDDVISAMGYTFRGLKNPIYSVGDSRNVTGGKLTGYPLDYVELYCHDLWSKAGQFYLSVIL